MSTTVWLTGLPSSGKSTLARALCTRLADTRAVEHLDGDEIRAGFFPELGFSVSDRTENVRRIGRMAAMLAGQRVVAVVSVIAPFRAARAEVRADHERRGLGFLEVYVDAPTDVCAERDVKGLYGRTRRGEMSGLTGVDDSYEPPLEPDLHLRTAEHDVARCVSAIEALLTGGAGAPPAAVALSPGSSRRLSPNGVTP